MGSPCRSPHALGDTCKKAEICDNHLSHDQYQADTNDDEYFDNWVNKFDLLCEPKYKVGLFGSMYFIGVISTLLFVPAIADKCGRKWVFTVTILLSAIAQLALVVTGNIYEAYVYLFSMLFGNI